MNDGEMIGDGERQTCEVLQQYIGARLSSTLCGQGNKRTGDRGQWVDWGVTLLGVKTSLGLLTVAF
jgi:hypothetical protein